MIIPEEIRKNVLFMKDKNGSLNIRSYKKNVSKETFNFLQEHNITITELFNLIKYDLSEFPKCPTCGSPVRNFYKNHTYCSNKCAQRSIEIKDKIKKTNLERFGVEYSSQNKEIRDKQKKTCLEKYGTEYTFQSKEIQDKVKATNLERYGTEYYTNTNEFKEKVKHTNVEKYGVENVWSSEEIKDKIKKIMVERYGAENYNQTIYSTINGRKRIYESFLSKLELKRIKFLSSYDDYISLKELKFKCLKCNTEFTSYDGNAGKIHCPNYAIEMSSMEEKDITNFIKSLTNMTIIENDRKVINPQELDIYIPERNLAIEYNGMYWHSDLFKDKNYHQNKFLKCKEHGIRLIQINEYDWLNKQHIIKSIIRNLFGCSENKIYARKCFVSEISLKQYKEFLLENHIQGPVNSKYRYGLFYNSELVSVIGFGKSRFKKGEMELHRFCSKLNYSIIGGFSKLIKHFMEQNICSEFVSYVDLNYFNGNGYFKNNFKFIELTQPNYYYWNGKDYLNRIQCQKHKLKSLLSNFDESKTEYENMINNGYIRIFDSGNLKLIYKK